MTSLYRSLPLASTTAAIFSHTASGTSSVPQLNVPPGCTSWGRRVSVKRIREKCELVMSDDVTRDACRARQWVAPAAPVVPAPASATLLPAKPTSYLHRYLLVAVEVPLGRLLKVIQHVRGRCALPRAAVHMAGVGAERAPHRVRRPPRRLRRARRRGRDLGYVAAIPSESRAPGSCSSPWPGATPHAWSRRWPTCATTTPLAKSEAGLGAPVSTLVAGAAGRAASRVRGVCSRVVHHDDVEQCGAVVCCS